MLRTALAAAICAAALLQALPSLLTAIPAATAQTLPPSVPESAEAARRALLVVLEEARAGEVRLARFTPDLAHAVGEQAPGVAAMLARLGAMRTVTHLGAVPGTHLHQFSVVYERGVVNWAVGLAPDGRISDLLLEQA